MTLRFIALLALVSLACGMQVPAQMPARATQTPGNAPATAQVVAVHKIKRMFRAIATADVDGIKPASTPTEKEIIE